MYSLESVPNSNTLKDNLPEKYLVAVLVRFLKITHKRVLYYRCNLAEVVLIKTKLFL